MRDETGQLRAELGRLCRGRGVLSSDLATRFGSRITALLDEDVPGLPVVGTTAGRADARAVLIALLTTAVARLPADLRLVAAAALGLEPSAQGRFLTDRIGWLTARLDRDERTVRRRLGEALTLLAEDLTAGRDRPTGPSPVPATDTSPNTHNPSNPSNPSEPWYLACLRSLVRLDLPRPEVYEERVVVAAQEGLESVVLSMSLPRPMLAEPQSRDLIADVLYGGLLVARERPSESLFRFVIGLPRPLAAGARHRLALRLTLAPGQAMADHYGLTPLTRCDEFHLRLRFAPSRPPTGVWLLDGLPPRAADDDPTGLPPVSLDQAGECLLRFTAPRLGRSHGACWRF